MVRLHVWDSNFAVENVSVIHNHPWHFQSTIISGKIIDRIYDVATGDPTHSGTDIICGPGGGAINSPFDVCLKLRSESHYCSGYSYSNRAEWFHESIPEDGTVTIIERFIVGHPDRATVFFPLGTKWVSAEPREAARSEILAMAHRALQRKEFQTL